MSPELRTPGYTRTTISSISCALSPKPLRWALQRRSAKRAAMFPFCLWLTIVEEERTIFYSKLLSG